MPPNYCIYKFNGNSGVYDTEKNVFIIEPLYEFIEYCQETNYYLVCKKMKDKTLLYGFLNQNNEVVIPFIFCYAEVFSGGCSVVSLLINDLNKFGFIDKTGTFVIPCEYDYAKSFNNDFAIVSIGGKIDDDVIPDAIINFRYSGGKYTLINKFNEKQFDFEFDSLFAHKDTNATYWTSGLRLMIINENGILNKVCFKSNYLTFDYLKYAGNGNFIGVTRRNINNSDNEEFYYLMDNEGYVRCENNFLLDTRYGAYHYCTKFYEGVTGVKLIERGYKTSDFGGRYFFNTDYYTENEGLDFGNMPFSNEYWYFINDEFKRIGKLEFEEIGFFREGLCPVKYNRKWGYINKKGDFVIEPKYKFAKSFNNGYAVVQTDVYQWSIISSDGEEIISKIRAIDIGDYSCGLFWIQYDKELLESVEALIVRKLHREEYLKNPENTLKKYLPPISRFEQYGNVLFGYINLQGDLIIKPIFHRISNFVNGFALVQQFNSRFWIDTNGKRYITSIYCEDDKNDYDLMDIEDEVPDFDSID